MTEQVFLIIYDIATKTVELAGTQLYTAPRPALQLSRRGQASILVPKTFKKAASHFGWPGHATAVTCISPNGHYSQSKCKNRT